MTTKLKMESRFCPIWAGVWHLASGVNFLWCLASVVGFVLIPVASAWAGDLTTDNLTVTKDATIMGNMYFSTTVGGTNGSGATATGGTITTNGNYRIHTFANVGTANFIVSGGSLTCDVLVVAGGGGSQDSGGGGGGAGGVILTNAYVVSGTNLVMVGAGGPANSSQNGSNSIFGVLTAFGGGYGTHSGSQGINGGSGGGAPSVGSGWGYGGTGVVSQGHNGGNNGGFNAPNYPSGAGGGAGSDGGNVLVYTNGARGGAGITSSISGSAIGYGGGGGGNMYHPGVGNEIPGIGIDGGGNGGIRYVNNGKGEDGEANTGGGGGGGAAAESNNGSSGGSGIVIVRYSATASSNITSLTISSNGISQVSASGSNVLMGKVGIGTNNPAEKLHVVGNVQVDGTNIVSAIKLGGETRATWPTGNLSASNNLSDITNQAAARANLGLGSAATNEAGAFLSPNGDGSQITGITAVQVGALSTNAGALIDANNLSDVANAGTARSNLGLGTAATNEASAFLSTAGGVVNGDISLVAPGGDIPMGIYTNQ